MQFGLQHPNFSFDYRNQDASQISDTLNNLVTKAENAGFDSFWVMDHFHQIPSVGKPGNIYRHPSILAKIGATLDVLSKGRLFME